MALAVLLLEGCLAAPRPVPVADVAPPAGSVPAAAPAAPVEAWRTDVGNGLEYGITVHGPVILATTTDRMLVAHAAADGRRFWGRRYGSPLVGAPVPVAGHVHFGTGYRDRKIHAVELELGRAGWERRTGEARTPVTVGSDDLYVGMEDGRVLALSLEDGTVRWERRLPDRAAWAPVLQGDQVIVATYHDTLYSLDAATGQVRGRLPLPGTPSAPPLVVEATLYLPLHPGVLAAVVLSGTQPALAWRAELADPVLAAPVRMPGGGLLLLDRAARLWTVDAAGSARQLVELGGAATGSLAAAAQGAVVGRLDGALFLVGADGVVRWRLELGDAIVSPVTVRADGLYVPLLHGEIVKFR
ncbi:MAG: PQQ-binding-like beta-propeller repeat protein [Gemmatimonadota bacterium]